MNRLDLQTMLESFQAAAGETPHVYYQPPENVKIVYPCFIYSDSDSGTVYANDEPYLRRSEYIVKYITKNPSPPMAEAMKRLPKTRFDRHYTAENLHHFSFVVSSEVEDREPSLDLRQIASNFLGGTND